VGQTLSGADQDRTRRRCSASNWAGHVGGVQGRRAAAGVYARSLAVSALLVDRADLVEPVNGMHPAIMAGGDSQRGHKNHSSSTVRAPNAAYECSSGRRLPRPTEPVLVTSASPIALSSWAPPHDVIDVHRETWERPLALGRPSMPNRPVRQLCPFPSDPGSAHSRSWS